VVQGVLLKSTCSNTLALLVYIPAMADNTKQLAQEFTQLVLDSIKMEQESKTRPRRPVLVAFQVKMSPKLRSRIQRACREKGIEQTQLVKHMMRQVIAVLLQDEEPGLAQQSLVID
jgi:predicted HicB family RNase H-like nuclease